MLKELEGYDWEAAFECCGVSESGSYGAYNSPDVRSAIVGADISLDPINLHDVVLVVASDEGENDESDWLCLGRVKDGRWFMLRAGCDYTGWDCQSGGCADVAARLGDLIEVGMLGQERKRLAV